MKKAFVLFALFWCSGPLLFAQHEYEVSAENPYGAPNPNAPAQIVEYQPMIGICDCKSIRRGKESTWKDTVNMSWEFKYIMNGMGVQDQTLKEDGSHAGSIRQYIADSSSWYVHYYSSSKPSPALGTWKGGKQENNIVLYKRQKAPNGSDGSYKITFSEISENGFNWIGAWVSVDESIVFPTWKIHCKKRKKQEAQPIPTPCMK